MPEVPPLVAAYEIGVMLNVGRQRVSQLAAEPGFPKPVAILRVGRVWLREDVIEWAERHGRTVATGAPRA